MDFDYTSYQSMLAAQESANWAFWSMNISIATAISTAITLIIAWKALHTWRRQEELKVKVDLKRSLIDLLDSVQAMPERWSYMEVNRARSILKQHDIDTSLRNEETKIFFNKQDMLAAHKLAMNNWMLCEGLLDDPKIEALWKEFRNTFRNYAMKGGTSSEVANALIRIIDSIVIFK